MQASNAQPARELDRRLAQSGEGRVLHFPAYDQPGSPPGQSLAEKGQKGVTRAILAPGWYFFNKLTTHSVEVSKVTEVGTDQLCILCLNQGVFVHSHLFRAQGAMTILGGPHARCYPQDAVKYFDYVLGFTDKTVVYDVLQDCAPHRSLGMHLTARLQPTALPGVRERWKFIEQTLHKAPLIKIVPMLSSLGCPYTCSFCIDAVIPYQPLDVEVIKEDLRFLVRKFRRPLVAWHDPNFGVRFNATMEAIEEAVPPDSIDFIAESSLSLLSERSIGAISSRRPWRYHSSVDVVRQALGPLWAWLPAGALHHDPHAYLKSGIG
jgi:hypothetical protein